MQIANYHTHTHRCNHASGTERDFVEAAIRAGFTVLGFADHSPYYFPGDYYSGFRMKPEESADYVETLLALREEYKNDIDIKIGYEMEYYPAFFDEALKIVTAHPCDYLILGQHFVGNEIDGVSVFAEPENPLAFLHRYVDQVIEAMGTGQYSYIAHPDVPRYDESDPRSDEELRRLCLAARSAGLPLELNMLGIADHRHYPHRGFWKIAGEVGNDVVIGCDAHNPAIIEDLATRAVCEEMIETFGLHQILTVPLHAPHR